MFKHSAKFLFSTKHFKYWNDTSISYISKPSKLINSYKRIYVNAGKYPLQK